MAQTNPIIALGCVCGVVLVGGGGIIANLPDVLVFHKYGGSASEPCCIARKSYFYICYYVNTIFPLYNNNTENAITLSSKYTRPANIYLVSDMTYMSYRN
jgi:hypothetical protein